MTKQTTNQESKRPEIASAIKGLAKNRGCEFPLHMAQSVHMTVSRLNNSIEEKKFKSFSLQSVIAVIRLK